jgi:hypothetical protein
MKGMPIRIKANGKLTSITAPPIRPPTSEIQKVRIM